MARGPFWAQKSPEAQLTWKRIFTTCLPDVPKVGRSPRRASPLPPRPPPPDTAPSQKVLWPRPLAESSLAPARGSVCSGNLTLCTAFPANENVALLVKGQLNPPNFCCTRVVSPWTSMLGKAARPWWCVYVCVHACMCVHACICAWACMGGLCACVRMRPLAVSLEEGEGDPASSASAALRRSTRVFLGLLHLRPSLSPAEAKGPNSGAKPRCATASSQTAMGTLNL